MIGTALVLLQAAVAQRAALIQSDRLQETSGVAVSRTHRGALWSHNDSGDGPYLYVTDLSGGDRGRLRVPGATAVDWEDIALGPCPRGPARCLYIGDTGDNARQRRWVTIYAVPEPAPGDSTTAPAAALRLRYPGGPRDVESLWVAAGDGALYLVSKVRSGPARLYRVDRAHWGSSGAGRDTVVTAQLIQEIRLPGNDPVTGAAIRPDGRLVALRTSDEIAFFRPGEGGRLTPVDAPRCRFRGLEAQGEAVDFLNDSTLVLTSERAGRRRATIDTVRCPRPPASTDSGGKHP